MENFNFRLQKVLDIKFKNEEESKVKYSKAQREKRAVEEELEILKSNYKRYSDEINIEDIVTRKITSNYLNTLSNIISIKSSELNKKQVILNEARIDLLNKQIERKSLEKLKKNKYILHKKEENQKEQNINDEFGIYSYLRRKSEDI
ncbi:flagellar export protein FliJ [Clostridium sp. D53t1_180928_C8]|uniref:flagellar export protein FliJ n=1 Tax=Clostridium sp. D53t1_180928_C8 TaxID=2787101 RepID=UPI0018AB8FB7